MSQICDLCFTHTETASRDSRATVSIEARALIINPDSGQHINEERLISVDLCDFHARIISDNHPIRYMLRGAFADARLWHQHMGHEKDDTNED